MIIGIPKEIKTRENRVGIVPGGVKTFIDHGHKVLIETGAGVSAGISDDRFRAAGAVIVPSADELWGQAEMIMKVKEPVEPEFARMRPGQILYTYLHLAAERRLTEVLVEKKVTGIAYETIELPDRSLPLLKPMSEVAGRMSVQVGARCLEKHNGGKGLLLGGVPGVRRGRICIIGGGVVGVNAAKMAIGIGAEVTILDVNSQRLAYLDDIFGNLCTTLMSNYENLTKSIAESDLVIGGVLVPGAKAPMLVTREMIRQMTPGSVVVDVAIDQGGCIETIRPTTHDNPVYTEEGVIHYGVTNIPGDVPLTSTYALTNVTLPFGIQLANKGLAALKDSEPLRKGLNTHEGTVTYKAVAEALGMDYREYRP